ncbi:MAG: lipid-A-disaccharide synthase [Verrucomicrobiota bacterium]
MKPLSCMLIAGDPSGDMLAAELVSALRQKVLAQSGPVSADVQPLQTALAPRFFGAGGPKMVAAGVEQVFDLTQHSVIGFAEVLKNLGKFRRLFKQLLQVALERQPDVIIGVDYGGFNLRFAKAIRKHAQANRGLFNNWNPKIVQFVSPQVWASRASRAYILAENHDLLLSIFPFEKAWYAQRVSKLRVKFVGHPMMGRGEKREARGERSEKPCVVLLPGSRTDEVRRHWPVVTGAFEILRREVPTLTGKMILPNSKLAEAFNSAILPAGLEIQIGRLSEALATAQLAITKSGTVTMECAFHGVPAVVFYKTSWPTYFIGKQIITVKYLAMPNLIADEPIYPEFVQQTATPENIAGVAVELLRNQPRRAEVQGKLARVIASLGSPGAPERAADAILSLL